MDTPGNQKMGNLWQKIPWCAVFAEHNQSRNTGSEDSAIDDECSGYMALEHLDAPEGKQPKKRYDKNPNRFIWGN
jgi:hypothetical protein